MLLHQSVTLMGTKFVVSKALLIFERLHACSYQMLNLKV